MPPARKIIVQILVVGLSIAATAKSSRAADSILLKSKFDAQKQAYVEIDTDAVQKMTGPDGKPMEIKSRSVYGLLEKAAPKGDTIVIDATIDRMLGATAFTESIKSLYDSDDPEYEEASPMHKDTFAPILHAPLKITVDLAADEPNDKAVEGGEPIRKKLKDMGDQNFVAKSLAEGDLTDKQIMSAFGELPIVLLPNREVKVGEGWKITRKDDFQQVGRVIMNYDCKLERIEQAPRAERAPRASKGSESEIAIISYTGTITKDEDEKPAKDQRLGKIDGTFTGTAIFDAAQGKIVELKREATAKVEVPPWWTKDLKAPHLKIDGTLKLAYTAMPAADREKKKGEIAERIAAAKAKREADEAAAMTGPVDPVTAENVPVAWLQWGGPNRNFCSDATGLENRWPKGGPPKLWERSLGDGFSAILSDGDTLYTAYSIREKDDPSKGDEVVIALDAKTGKTRWEHKYAAPWPKQLQMEFGAGPHSTPILVGDKLYAVGCTAKLFCFDKKTGKVIWSKDLHEEYKASLMMRGYGSSPLAYKGNILLPISKEKGSGIIAFNQADGSVAWKGGECDPSYASLQVIDIDGTEQLVTFTGKAVVGLDPTDASTKWSVDHPTQWGANISTPVWNAEDKNLFISSAYGMGSRGVKLEKAGSQIAAKEIWFNPKMKVQHADAVRVGDCVYGSSGDFGPAFLCCMNAKTGKLAWQQRGIAKANVLYADGKLIVLDEDGTLYLVKADPAKYRLLAKAKDITKKTAWTVPTLVGRTLYLRDREKIMALDLGSSKGST